MAAEEDQTLKNEIHADPVASVACPKCGLEVAAGTKFCPNDATPIDGGDSSLTVPGYRFIKLIGSGGMGDVYEAEHIVLKKRVAIKTLKSHLHEGSAFRRFQTEAQAASRLAHPNIVSVYDCSVSQTGEPYMIMDLVKGETLAQYLKRKGDLTIEESLQIISDICAGVICAHEKNILHRDLKPSNVILDETGEKRVARVLDFGLAKMLENEGMVARMTRTGEVMGTPSYMSPEQVNGHKLDQRSDIYSIGCILYEMLTGSPPILGKNAMETMVRQLNEIPLSLSEAAMKEFPQELEQIIARALAKDPANRFQTLKEMLFSLYQIGYQSKQNVQSTAPPEKKKAPVFVLLAIAGTIFVGAVLFCLATSKKEATSLPKEEVTKSAPLVTPSTQSAAIKMAPQESSECDVFFIEYLKAHSRDPEIDVGHLNDARDYTDISDAALVPLKDFYHLRKLSLGDCEHITIKGLENLVGLPNLEFLELRDTKIGDEIFPFLKRRPLGSINLSRSQITNAGFQSLSPDVPLREIVLKGSRITDDGMKDIGRLKHLKVLNLDSCEIGDKGVAEISKLDLDSLSLQRALITDNCVKSLLKMRNLTGLCIAGTDIDDDAFRQLVQLKKLVFLNIAECPKIGLESIAIIHKALPKCNIVTSRARNSFSPVF